MSSESMYAVWSCRHDAKLMDFFSTSRYAALTLPTSCQFASSFPYHASLPGLVFMMLRCLILSTSCYAASPSRCHTTLPGIFVWIFEFVFILLCCSIVFTSCCTAWPLIATPYYLLYLLQIAVFQLDLVFVVSTLHGVICFMLPCFTLSTSCQTASCPLDKVKLFDLVFTVLRCLTFSTSCYHDWPFPRQALPLHLNNMILPVRGWIWSQWYYSAGSSLPRFTLLHFSCLMSNCLMSSSGYAIQPCPYERYAAWSSMPHAELVNLPYPNVMLLDVLYITLCYFIWISWCYAAWSSLSCVALLDLPYLTSRCLVSPRSC